MSSGAAIKEPTTAQRGGGPLQSGPTWQLNTRIMDQTEAQLLRILRVVRDFDVPYLAGYSRDGKTVYIDSQMPDGFVYRGKKMLTDRYLVIHESVEKTLIDQLGLHYLHAHQIAERAEESAVEADGIDVRFYNDFMNRYIDIIGNRAQYPNCPPDLDMTSYHDSNDQRTIDRMRFAKAA